jgi:2,3-bisphosphoglycerate-independent phosphoglycerate mutase
MNYYPYAISEAIREAYKRGEDDEAMEPICLADAGNRPLGRIQNGDSVIFYDIRGEREVELTSSFTDADFTHFPVEKNLVSHWVTMIQYDPTLNVRVAFPPIESLKNTLSEVVTSTGRKVCKICESEKSIHIRFFMNGKHNHLFDGETHMAVESFRTHTMDQFPEMKAREVADITIEKLKGSDELIIVNFANIDVLGHIENESAILQAVNCVDTQVGRLIKAARETGVTVLITSDHGSAEKWLYPEGSIDTGHSTSPVHFIWVDPHPSANILLREHGGLADIAPTVLHLFGIPKPSEMTGQSLVSTGLVNARRILLIITDGWGFNENAYGNLLLKADTPVVDQLLETSPHTLLQASGLAVGLPEGTVGNSEAGHMHIGAGRIIPSDRVRIQNAIEDGSFYKNEAFLWAIQQAKNNNKNLHLLGIISFFSSHGSIDYLRQLLRMAANEKIKDAYIHGLLGRRGERPESGARYTRQMEKEAVQIKVGHFVSIIGRHWALDREHNWDRIEKTYRWLVYGDGHKIKMS